MSNPPKSLPLPELCTTSIYSRSLLVHTLLMPIGVAFDRIRAWTGGPDNEKDPDTYSEFLATSVELVDRNRLCFWQRYRLSRDPKFKTDPIYLVSFVTRLSDGSLKGRDGFANGVQLRRMSLDEPTDENPIVGDGKSIMPYLHYKNEYSPPVMIDWTALGQFWGWSRPRMQKVSLRLASRELVDDVNAKLADPKTVINRTPLAVYWTPTKSLGAILVVGGAIARLVFNGGGPYPS